MLAKLFSSLFSGLDSGKPLRKIENHSLYHFSGCGFCFRVQIAMKQLGIEMEKRNIHQNSAYRDELQKGGGKTTVPCLRIDREGQIEWMYESADIVRYLRANFTDEQPAGEPS